MFQGQRTGFLIHTVFDNRTRQLRKPRNSTNPTESHQPKSAVQIFDMHKKSPRNVGFVRFLFLCSDVDAYHIIMTG